MNTDRKQTNREVEEYPGNVLPCELHAHMEIWWPQLTFDSGNYSSSCTQDVHRVEPLVFADYGLQDSQQLPETLMNRLVEAFLVLWKNNGFSKSPCFQAHLLPWCVFSQVWNFTPAICPEGK